MTVRDENGHITWRAGITIILSVVIGMVGVLTFVMTLHQQQPHVGAIRRDEYATDLRQLEKTIDQLEHKIEDRFDKLDTKIERWNVRLK